MPKELVNFYDNKGVKKYQTKAYNPHFADTDISLPTRVIEVGSSGAGKTNIIMNYLLLANETFVHVFVVYKEVEPLYQFLQDKFKENVTFFDSLDKLPTVQELPYTQDGNVLVIFDDQVGDKNQAKIFEYFKFGRKVGVGVTCFYLSQSFYQIPKFIRENTDYIIIVKIGSNKDLKSVLRDYSLGVDINTLTRLYKHATQTFPSFFKLSLKAPQDKMFSKNFTEFIQV